MTKSELVQKLAEANPHLYQRDVEAIVTAIFQEISAALQMPIGGIGPTRARSLERLRRELERDGLVAANAF